MTGGAVPGLGEAVAGAPLAVMVCDAQGRVLVAGGGGLAELGRLAGHDPADPRDVAERLVAQVDGVRADLDRCLTGEAFRSVRVLRGRAWQGRWAPRPDGGATCVVVEVTEQWRAEQHLALLQGLQQRLVADGALVDLLAEALALAGIAGSWSRGAVWVAAGEGAALRPAARWTSADGVAADATAAAALDRGRDESPVVDAWARRVPVWHECEATGVTTVAVPVVSSGEVVAVLAVQAPERRLPDPLLGGLVSEAARQVGALLDHRRGGLDLRLVQACARAAESLLPLPDACRSVLGALCEAVGSERGSVWGRAGGFHVELARVGLGAPQPDRDAGESLLPSRSGERLLVPVVTGEVDHGAVSVLLPPGTPPLHPRLRATLREVGSQLGVAVQRDEVRRQLVQQARTDPLTGLPNLTGLHEDSDGVLARGCGGALVLLDVARLRRVNGALGLGAGDQVLRATGVALTAAAPRSCTVAAVPGGSFVVLVPDVGELGDGGDLLSRVRAFVARAERPVVVGDVPVDVEIRCGVAAVPPGSPLDAPELLRVAGIGLADAKADDVDVVVVRSRRAGEGADDLRLLAELRLALDRDELLLHYQPQVDATGETVAVEALVRWDHPRRGLLPPSAFLPQAEPTALVHDLTLWTLEQAVAQSARWLAAGTPLPCAVNVSHRSLVRDDLVAEVREALVRHRVPPSLLTIEITETALVSRPAVAAERVRSLRALGCRVSLDDFGTGSTSLSLLRTLDVDELKIDRSFVAGATTRRADSAIVRSVLELGTRLGMDVVAEGVEDRPTQDLLHALGCTRLQGFLFAHPQTAQDLDRVLAAEAAVPDQRETSGGVRVWDLAEG